MPNASAARRSRSLFRRERVGLVSAAFGVATVKVGEATYEDLVSAADAVLHAAKRNGCDIVVGRPPKPGGPRSEAA